MMRVHSQRPSINVYGDENFATQNIQMAIFIFSFSQFLRENNSSGKLSQKFIFNKSAKSIFFSPVDSSGAHSVCWVFNLHTNGTSCLNCWWKNKTTLDVFFRSFDKSFYVASTYSTVNYGKISTQIYHVNFQCTASLSIRVPRDDVALPKLRFAAYIGYFSWESRCIGGVPAVAEWTREGEKYFNVYRLTNRNHKSYDCASLACNYCQMVFRLFSKDIESQSIVALSIFFPFSSPLRWRRHTEWIPSRIHARHIQTYNFILFYCGNGSPTNTHFYDSEGSGARSRTYTKCLILKFSPNAVTVSNGSRPSSPSSPSSSMSLTSFSSHSHWKETK